MKPSTPTSPSRFRRVKDLQPITLLGHNNAGIYLVRDQLTGKYLIEKRLKPEDATNGFAKREINILYQLSNHSNIAKLVWVELDDVGLFEPPSATIYTEFCNGGTLEDKIKKMQKTKEIARENFLWHVLGSLVEAVRYCQRGNGPLNPMLYDGWNVVYHRDIQPSNVFLTSDGEAKTGLPLVVLGDFGCSTSFAEIASGFSDPVNVERQDCTFAPPEAPRYGLGSDIYQIGLVMWCLMFWELDPGLDFEVLRDDVLETEDYTDELKEIVAGCLEVDPLMRWPIEKLVAKLEDCKRGAPTLAWSRFAGNDLIDFTEGISHVCSAGQCQTCQ
jgi:serine/threonine protein kinase